MAYSYDYLFKLIIVGEKNVGKSNLLHQIASGNPVVEEDQLVFTERLFRFNKKNIKALIFEQGVGRTRKMMKVTWKNI